MVFMKKQRQDECQLRTIQPLIDIREKEKEVILEAEMAGLTKDDISLDLKGNELTLKGKGSQSEEAIPKGYNIVHRERCPLEYVRTFVLGEEIDSSKIDAQYENGILRVQLVKSEEVQPKKIEIRD